MSTRRSLKHQDRFNPYEALIEKKAYRQLEKLNKFLGETLDEFY